MRWRQFFTPAASLSADEARQTISAQPADRMTILDVRQPKEYEAGHIPGSKLIPLPELQDRLDELEPDKPTLVY